MKADGPFLDKLPYSRLGFYRDNAELVLTAECSQNLMALLCNTWFKQCSQVEDDKTGEPIWMPALMCQQDCENYISVWDECVATLQEDADAFEKFKLQMGIMGDRGFEIVNKDRNFDKLVTPIRGWNPFEPLRCTVTGGVMADIEPANAVNAYIFGQYPVRSIIVYYLIFTRSLSISPIRACVFFLPHRALIELETDYSKYFLSIRVVSLPPHVWVLPYVHATTNGDDETISRNFF